MSTLPLSELDRSALPDVSVVIPTRKRPELLARAIRSVLRQTLQSFEIIVVLDGPDAGSIQAVQSFRDWRIRLVTLARSTGGGNARNAGVAAARGEWIAFLDDDDEFLDRKLEIQLDAARKTSGTPSLVVCKARVLDTRIDAVWPLRFPATNELLCDYLFCRRSLRQGEGFLQTSTFFLSRSLALTVPFRQDLPRHQDWDWLIRLQFNAGCQIVPVRRPLSIYHIDSGPSISRISGWHTSLQWARETILPQSRKAYSFFIATQCVSRLNRSDCWTIPAFRNLARECFSSGRPSPLSGALFAAFWVRSCVRNFSRT